MAATGGFGLRGDRQQVWWGEEQEQTWGGGGELQLLTATHQTQCIKSFISPDVGKYVLQRQKEIVKYTFRNKVVKKTQ